MLQTVLLCILLPAALGNLSPDIQKVEPKEATHVLATKLKDVASAEIVKYAVHANEKDKGVSAGGKQKINPTEIVEITTVDQTKASKHTNLKPMYKKKNMAKMKKWRPRRMRKQKNGIKNKNRLTMKKLRAKEDKRVSTDGEQNISPTEIVEITTADQAKASKHTNLKPRYKKKNIAKIKKWRPRWMRKQKNGLKNRNRMRLKKLQLKRKQQLLRRNRWRNRGKQQMRNIEPNGLSDVINQILSQHKKGEGSKLSTNYIRLHVLPLMKGKKVDSQTTKPVKDCAKPLPNKKKSRKLLRSLNTRKRFNKQPKKGRVSFRGRQRVSTSKGKVMTNEISKTHSNTDGSSKTYVTSSKGKNGKVKSKITVSFGRKKKPSRISKKGRRRSSKRSRSRNN